MLNAYPNADFSKIMEPVSKLIALNMERFESVIGTQTAATKNFIDLTEARMKVASEIKDFDGLVGFMNEQTEIARSNMEKMIEESKSATEEVVAYGKEVQKILGDSVESAKKATRKKAA